MKAFCQKLNTTLTDDPFHPYMLIYMVAAVSAGVVVGLHDYTPNSTVPMLSVMISVMFGLLIPLGALSLVGVIVAYGAASEAYDRSGEYRKNEKAEVESLFDGDANDLAFQCKRLARFLHKVDYRKERVPIGIRFENRKIGNCMIQWSIGEQGEPIHISKVAGVLARIIDELELSHAIPETDENLGYTAP